MRRWWFYLVLLAYALLIVAVTVLRVDEMSTGADGSRPAELAAGVIMLFTTVGPAWVAELTMRRRAAAVVLSKERRKLVRRIRRADRQRLAAEHYVESHIARPTQRWDAEAARRRAVYETAHRRQTASLVDRVSR